MLMIRGAPRSTLLPYTTLVGSDTVVVADAVLLAAFGSGSLPVTVAVLVMVPSAVGDTSVVIAALAPEGRVPTLQVTVPEALVQPELHEPQVAPAGRVSVTAKPVAELGPLLVTLRV